MTGVFVEAGSFRGRDSVIAYLRGMLEEFDEFHSDVENLAGPATMRDEPTGPCSRSYSGVPSSDR